MRNLLDQALASAGPDDLLAAFTQAAEAELTTRIGRQLHAHREVTERELREARRRADHRASAYDASHVHALCAEAAESLVTALTSEEEEARQAAEECDAVLAEMHRDLDATRSCSLSESVLPLSRHLGAARERLDDLLALDREVLHELALQEASRRQANTADGITLSRLDRLLHDDLGEWIEELTDGSMEPMVQGGIRSTPVLTSLPDGKSLVIQPEQVSVPHSFFNLFPVPTVGLPRVQQLSRTAGDRFPGALIAVASNGRFSRPARRHAREHRILLIDRDDLRRWMEWGTPLSEILGSGKPPQASSGRALRQGPPTALHILEPDRDGLLTAFTWTTEMELIQDAAEQLQLHHDMIDRELAHARRRELYRPDFHEPWWTPLDAPCRLAAGHLRKILADELENARTACAAVKEISDALRRWYGRDLRERYRRGALNSPSELDEAARHLDGIQGRAPHIFEALARDRESLHDLAMREAQGLRFTTSPGSVSLAAILSMSSRGFEEMVAALLQRDGFNVLQRHGGAGDRGADVIAVAPTGEKLVAQCKLITTARRVEVGVLYALNGTARPVHGADLVVAVTSSEFTKPALKFARQHAIVPFGNQELAHWATWGESLQEILGLGKANGTDAAPHSP